METWELGLTRLSAVVVILACVGCVGAALSACASETKKCASGDLDCYAQDMFVLDENGHFQQVVLVAAAAIPDDGSGLFAAGGGPADAPYFTSASYSVVGTDAELWLGWNDPTGQTPALCFCPCPKHARCFSGRCGCVRGKKDGQTAGMWRGYLGFHAEPAQAGATESFDLQFIPLSTAPGSSIDPVTALQAQTADAGPGVVKAGPGTDMPVTVSKDRLTTGTGSGGDGGGVGQCSADAECVPFGTRNCSGGGNAFCEADALCHCCEVVCGGASGTCSCSPSCASSADCPNVGDICWQGTCTYPLGGSPNQ